jgi:hypothetical protein
MRRILTGITAFLFGVIMTPIAATIITIEAIFYKNTDNHVHS